MKLCVITLCRNEVTLVPFFLRHYGSFADKIIVLDNQSTDGSLELLQAHPKVVVEHYDTNGEIRDDIHMHIKSNRYKEEDADWFIVVDFDELIYHEDLRGLLARFEEKGVTVASVQGYNMIGTEPILDDGVSQLYDLVKDGVPDVSYSKLALFHRTALPQYDAGAHYACFNGIEHRSLESVRLLHYKLLWRAYAVNRASKCKRSKINIDNGWGFEAADVDTINYAFDDIYRRKIRVM
jgi:hypothetical protein